MTVDYELDAAGLAGFVTRAREHAEDLLAASPTGDGSLAQLSDESGALSDPDIVGLLTDIFSERQTALTDAVNTVDGAITSVEQAGLAVGEADSSSHTALTAANTGAFDPLRFSVQ